MAIEGSLELFKLPEILQMVSQQQKTGILTVQGPQDIIAVSFLRGQIVTVDSLNQTQEEGLSEILVREGLLTGAQFARASAEHQSSGTRLFDLLVDRGYVQRAALLKALRLHATRLLDQLLRWEEGEFKFYGGDEVPYEEGFVPITVEEAIVQSAQNAAALPRRAAAVPAGHRPLPVGAALPAPAGTGAGTGETAATARSGQLRVVHKEGAPERSHLTAIPMPGDAADAAAAAHTGPYRKMRVEPSETPPRPLLAKAAAVGLAALVFAILFTAPSSLVLPYPWQAEDRLALVREERTSLYQKIDRAAKTWFLLHGHFPERLAQLAESGFLAERDLSDPEGHPLQYSASEESYVLQPLRGGKPAVGEEASEAITGNFLLDPDFLTLPAESAAQPLVLLD